MPSPADARPRARPAAEWTLRVLALALLALALWLELRPAAPAAGVVARADGDALRASLARWTDDPDVERVHASLGGVPTDTTRDWLRALRGGGVEVGWSSPGLPAVALAVEAVAAPAAPVRLLAAASAGREVAFADAAGELGVSAVAGGGASASAGAVARVATATVGDVRARASAPAPLTVRPVLVLGRAGWESKFVAAALEEQGWTVVARFAVAPGVEVTQGALGTIDTSTFGAVVALDSTAASRAAAIARYVRAGGGLVLGARAAALGPLAPLAAGTLTTADRAEASLLQGGEPRRGLLLRAVSMRDDAIPLERRGERVAVAARRVGAGRVVQVGYDETWRWRMAGPEGAPEAHREWWSGLVSAAAYAPSAATAHSAPAAVALDDAPVARLIAALGPAGAEPDAAGAAIPSRGAPPWLFAVIAALLLAEWLSRRTRGAA